MVEIVSSEVNVAPLRAATEGKVYLPGEPAYEAARRGWNLAVEQSPQVVVDAETAADVQAAVRFARSNGLPVGVMATGHGTPKACDGLLIRTARMTQVQVDPQKGIATIAGGALVRDVQSAAAQYGLSMLPGSSTGVGVVGYVLGGGYGLMLRKHGLAVDRVLSFRIVTPEGDLVEASALENADLFWAVRGGGGAFGVVVEMTLELIPQAMVYGGSTIYPADDAQADAIVRAWAAWTRELPEEVTSTAMIMNLPPLPTVPEPLRGQTVVAINACVCGDLKGAEALIAPMRSLGTPILDLWGEMPMTESDQIYNDPKDPMPGLIRGATLQSLDDAAIDRLMKAVGPIAQMPQVCVQLRHVSGAMARVCRDATPLDACRDANYLVYTIGVPNPFASAAALHDHAEEIFIALGEAVLTRGPLNFIGEGGACSKAVRGVYGEAQHARLLAVKRAFDPENAFRYASVGLD